ncbi:MAG TPA: glycosyltransferase family 2 protein [Acidimicrobiales bacterium]|nr:glycosyltransferase family 2 protein [Acidimicrobiales bacterium]
MSSGPTGNPEVRSLSACFPCYNDAETIGTMVDSVHKALDPLVDDLEVIVANDGSQDGSAAVLDELAATRPWLRVIHHEANRGYGGALLSAFGAATTDWIFYTDGDAQYDATEAADLVALVTPTVDVVQGWKLERGDRWYRKVIGRTYHHVVKLLFNLHVRDTDCDFRLFRRSLLAGDPLRSTSGVICVEMMRTFEQRGARFVEAPVHHYHRPSGRSQFFRLPAIARSARQLLALWWELMVLRRPR